MDPCDNDLFQNGTRLVRFSGPRSHTMDEWIKSIRAETGQRVDWHLAAGWAIVIASGDLECVRRALKAGIERLVDAYMACPDNFTRQPQREDVLWRWIV